MLNHFYKFIFITKQYYKEVIQIIVAKNKKNIKPFYCKLISITKLQNIWYYDFYRFFVNG